LSVEVYAAVGRHVSLEMNSKPSERFVSDKYKRAIFASFILFDFLYCTLSSCLRSIWKCVFK